MRLKFGSRFGPAREIHAGSGYWSQDGALQVLALPAPPTHLCVRWPAAQETTVPLPPNATNITLTTSGKLTQP